MQSHRQTHTYITGRLSQPACRRKLGKRSSDEYSPKHRLQFRARQARFQAQVDDRLESQSQRARNIDAVARDLLRCV
jgi:hypothetical protein